MKRAELQGILRGMGVPTRLYNLDGKGRTDERFCLELINDEWTVYFSERGVKTTNEKFISEDAACQFILEQFC